MNNIQKAVETFKQLITRYPDSFSGHYYLGRLYTIQGKYEPAVKELQESFRLNPDLIEALYSLVEIYDIKKNRTKLIETYKTILEADPEDLRAALALAIAYHTSNQDRKADILLSDLGKRNDPDQNVLKHVARYYIKKGLYADAVYLLNGMLKTSVNKGDLFYFLGVSHNEAKHTSEAMAMFDKVPATSKYYEKAVLFRAFHFMDMGNNSIAIDILDTALKNNPSNLEFIIYLGSFYEEEEMYQKAVSMYLKGLNIDKSSTRLYFRLGVAYDKKGDRNACIKEMKNVIRLDPEDANALNYLGYTYADLGMNLQEAEELILRALKLKPDDGYITDSLGWVYYKKGNYEKAITTLQKAVTLIPDDPILLEHLGDAFEKTLDREKALEYYKRSLKFKKKEPEGLEIKIERLTNKQATLSQ
jgi:tetratricopeptide (TPR) repeat protein